MSGFRKGKNTSQHPPSPASRVRNDPPSNVQAVGGVNPGGVNPRLTRRRTVCGRTEQRRPPVSKRYETKVRIVWGSFLLAAAALKTPTRNGYNAQGVNLKSNTDAPSPVWFGSQAFTSARVNPNIQCIIAVLRYVLSPKIYKLGV